MQKETMGQLLPFAQSAQTLRRFAGKHTAQGNDLQAVELLRLSMQRGAADDETALVLMPGLAFDPEGHRCGYGGGFYDKYLAAHPKHVTLALCYGFQMFSHLDTDAFDIPVQYVISAPVEEEKV
mgnify:CR=1 FL=1